ncbi:hypothetical protein BESB_018490 [Besnoitia besnoiti]|uniref:Uncharacterized protein n=1 Tax=Besnoitia besnoiti TaxID=94643 RepID=A0A2A9M8B3_BESBE|nr:hypothetical protein BESB_018490 [Besnoitia besnoiti]PFH32531.1 hypothetical protein BESB_018490 [Besnoitia besnoiti]
MHPLALKQYRDLRASVLAAALKRDDPLRRCLLSGAGGQFKDNFKQSGQSTLVILWA